MRDRREAEMHLMLDKIQKAMDENTDKSLVVLMFADFDSKYGTTNK